MLSRAPWDNRKRNRDVMGPWERDTLSTAYTSDDEFYGSNYSMTRPQFSSRSENCFLDIDTKRVAMRASIFVVSLVSFSGDQEVFQGSGILIETTDKYSIILTSADIVRYPPSGNTVAESLKVVVHLFNSEEHDGQIVAVDFHYNLAAIKIKIESDTPLTIAVLRYCDDSITVDPNHKGKPLLHRHSDYYNINPGDKVIALGRYFTKPHELMAATGEFSIGRCDYECKELFTANCKITKCGAGGPLVNCNGEVLGICFYFPGYTPFLPMNLASKWWNQYKTIGETHRPWLPMELTNLYAARLGILDKIIQKFPTTFKGVIVEEVVPGSSAHLAGICPNDVIVEFGGKTIQSFLELLEVMWDKVGEPVELVVLRVSDGVRLHLSMVVDKATPEKFYRWPLLNTPLIPG